MMKLTVVAVALLGVVSPVQAKTLWNNLDTNMSQAEVKALYPNTGFGKLMPPEIELANGCKATVYPQYNGDKMLNEVELDASYETDRSCREMVIRTMEDKYGPVQNVREKVRDKTKDVSSCYSGRRSTTCEIKTDVNVEVRTYRSWIVDGVEITLRTTSKDDAVWKLVYRIAPEAMAPNAVAASKL